MSNLLRVLSIAMLAFVGGCQVNHTLPEPTLNQLLTLPQVSVQTQGSVPGPLIRNHLRSTGVFEQVREGFDPGGYNIQVLSLGDYYGFSNIPNQLLSAFSLFIIPASVSWETEMTFRVTRGQEEVATYRVDNKTTHYNGLFVHPDGRGDNIRRIINSFAAQVQADAALFKLTPLKPVHTPMPVAPATLQRHIALIVSYQVNADGSVSDVTVDGDAPELARSAVLETVRAWRYEPWTPSPEAPARQRTSRPIILKPTVPGAHAGTELRPGHPGTESLRASVAGQTCQRSVDLPTDLGTAVPCRTASAGQRVRYPSRQGRRPRTALDHRAVPRQPAGRLLEVRTRRRETAESGCRPNTSVTAAPEHVTTD